MDDGFGEFLRVATVLVIGCIAVPWLCQWLFFGGPVLGSAIPILLVIWILWHVYSGLADS